VAKVDVHINLDYDLLIRAKLNKLNLSKEFNDYLKRILDISSSVIKEDADISNEIKNIEVELLENERQLIALKLKKENTDKKKEAERLEALRWEKVPVK